MSSRCLRLALTFVVNVRPGTRGEDFFVSKMLCVLCIVLFVIPSFLSAQRSRGVRTSVRQIDFFFTLHDGTVLDCTKFYPDTTHPSHGWPSIIYCHGYADSKYGELDIARAQAEYGFYTFVFSMRGQGISGGLSNLISTLEMNDLRQVVAYVKADSAIDSTRLGIFGSSQGGILPFMAACNGLSVRCILSDLASPEFASSWIENGSPKVTLFFSVDYDATIVRYSTNVKRIRNWILSKQTDKWDSLAFHMPQGRDFANQVDSCTVPMLFTNGWQDNFFNTLGMIHAINHLRHPFRVYLGATNGHGADSSRSEDRFISKLEGDWLDFWMYGIPNGVLDSNAFAYASSHYPLQSNGQWSYSHYSSKTWPPENISSENFYFHPNRSLGTTENTASQDTVGFLNDLRDTSLTMLQAIKVAFKGPFVDARFTKQSICFDTPGLTKDCHMTGTPSVNLYYSSTADVCQYNFQIWEVRPNNTANFVTRLNYTDRHCTPQTITQRRIEGISDSHLFQRGNRIRIVVTNLDTQPADSVLLSNPHVLPVLKCSYNTIYMSHSMPSAIALPIQNYPTEVFAEAQDLLATPGLDQNFPAPFNPTTTLQYLLTTKAKVILKVYNTLGQEIRMLVDEIQEPGYHSVEWNAKNNLRTDVRSGVYFYRLQIGGFVQTKGMLLVN